MPIRSPAELYNWTEAGPSFGKLYSITSDEELRSGRNCPSIWSLGSPSPERGAMATIAFTPNLKCHLDVISIGVHIGNGNRIRIAGGKYKRRVLVGRLV